MKQTSILILIGIVGIAILSLNTLDVFSIDKINIVQSFNSRDSAESIFVSVTEGDGKQLSFNTFSRIGIVRSSNPQFLLESIPSHDNKEFLKFVSDELNMANSNYARDFFDVTIDIMSSDGRIIETMEYKQCKVDSYFVYTNDAKGTYSLLNRDSSKSEIRDVTKFDCVDLDLKI